MTQKVWILWSNISSTVYGVFSSKEKAQATAMARVDDDDDEYDPSDWSLIEMPLDEIKVL